MISIATKSPGGRHEENNFARAIRWKRSSSSIVDIWKGAGNLQREGRPGVLVLKCASMILIGGIMEPGARCKHVVMYSYWPGVLKAERAPPLWYLNFNADLYFSIYIYFSLSLSLVANNRRISLVYVVRYLLEKTLILYQVFSWSSTDIRTNVGITIVNRLDWSNLQNWILEKN